MTQRIMVGLIFAWLISFWAMVAGLITGIHELRSFGAIGVVLFFGLGLLVDRYWNVSHGPVGVERPDADWQWPERDNGRNAA